MKKLLNKKGFTLMEMLIVIAIIVILVAIAVPSFSASLEEANAATDEANLRAAKAAAVVMTLDDTFDSSKEYYYDLDDGVLYVKDGATTYSSDTDNGSCKTHSTAYVKVTYSGTTPTVVWSAGGECNSTN